MAKPTGLVLLLGLAPLFRVALSQEKTLPFPSNSPQCSPEPSQISQHDGSQDAGRLGQRMSRLLSLSR